MENGSIDIPTRSGPLPARIFAAEAPRAALVFAHGAGAGQDHPWMRARATDLQARGVSVLTFDFPYKARGRRLPDRGPVLVDAFRDVVTDAAVRFDSPLLIGGKSMGGRIATMLAAEPELHGAVIGVVSMGYPLHPPGKPDQLRVAHLSRMHVPWLVIQGTRDPFGSPTDITEACADAGARPAVIPIEQGGHGFEVPKRTGAQADVFAAVADGVVSWLDTLLSASRQ